MQEIECYEEERFGIRMVVEMQDTGLRRLKKGFSGPDHFRFLTIYLQ